MPDENPLPESLAVSALDDQLAAALDKSWGVTGDEAADIARSIKEQLGLAPKSDPKPFRCIEKKGETLDAE